MGLLNWIGEGLNRLFSKESREDELRGEIASLKARINIDIGSIKFHEKRNEKDKAEIFRKELAKKEMLLKDLEGKLAKIQAKKKAV